VTTVSSEPATKADIKEAIDELRRDLKRDVATKDDLERFATKDDLERFATKEDLEQRPTRDEIAKLLEPYATKTDLEIWGGALHAELGRQIGIVLERQEDHLKVLLEHLGGRHDALRNDLDTHVNDHAVHRVPRRRS
jgi:hypothetical protein